MFGDVWDWAGVPRKTREHIGGNILPAAIPSELQKVLYELHQMEKENVSVTEIVTKVHHKIVYIHPFEGGNGRFSRMIVDLYLNSKNLPIMNWPSDKDFIEKKFKPRYISALKKADMGDYSSFLELHSEYWQPTGKSK